MTSPAIDETHDAARTSWIESANGHGCFPIQNLPLGVFSVAGDAPRGGIAIGDSIIDLKALAASQLLQGQAQIAAEAASAPQLNALLEMGAQGRVALRKAVSELLSNADHEARVEPMIIPRSAAAMHLPARIGDYTDFYVGIHHATNIGSLFRPDNPLLPNYKHIPIGYHGRASSIRPSGHLVHHPNGQRKAPEANAPLFGPTQKLDYELELGVWIGPGNELGQPIPIDEASHHIAGLCLLNDWSARDFQAWEYQPLGPFLAKNFLTTISSWIVTIEALAPFRIPQPARPTGDPRPLPYLWDEADQAQGALALTLEVGLRSQAMAAAGMHAHRIGRGPASNMYWTIAQMVAHHSCNGCNLQPGDLLGTGTISAATSDGLGSLMEITRNGSAPIELPTGESRAFLEGGDELTLTAICQADGFVSIGFGECTGIIHDGAVAP
ncbi:fumarylacetoacetase [Sphingobium sp. AN641]|uniref:fumarylacetoacetase n=1 Tax=Sphingobium sp. AN641 TaxID=3133443 RepID=UPI0030C16285